MTVDLRQLKIGYVPYSPAFDAPGDRRRFVNYARQRGLDFEIADPAKSYDVVVLSERADISVWSRYPKGQNGGRIVYDLIDSYLAIPRTDLKGRLRGLAKFLARQSRYLQFDHWKAIEAMCRRADAVVCTTDEQKADIAPHCANVHIVLDIHSMVTRTSKQDYAAHRPLRLVWEGLPQTLPSLAVIAPVLEKLQQRFPLELHLVTDLEYRRYLGRYGKADTLRTAQGIFPNVQLHAWNETTCAEIISSCDIAVIPLDRNDPFVTGKPENKLLLLWRLGMPTVVSATPAYRRAMSAAGIDLACADTEKWQQALEQLAQDEAARRHAGEAGRRFAEMQHGEMQTLARWDAVLHSLFTHTPQAASTCAA